MTERKKRTTIKDAFEQGKEEGRREFENLVLDTMDEMLEKDKELMEQYPRNTKFVEIEVDTIKELREKVLYNKNHDDKYVGKRYKLRL